MTLPGAALVGKKNAKGACSVLLRGSDAYNTISNTILYYMIRNIIYGTIIYYIILYYTIL